MKDIAITGKYDGGNPQNDCAIVQLDDSTFRIAPEIEDDNVGYKFRLDVQIKNNRDTSEEIKIIVDWVDQIYSKYRDIIYVKENHDKWHCINARTHAGETIFSISAKRGLTTIALSPSYNYEKYIEFIDRIPVSKCLSKELVYKTEEGRLIYCLISKSDQPNSKRIFVTARTHPYETAGSYNVEGIVDGIINSTHSSVLSKYDIYIIPMVCPDGVHNGLCRLNRLEAPDLSREINEYDNLSKVYMQLLASIRPHVFLEYHNWMLRKHDGVFYLPWWLMMRTVSRLNKQIRKEKRKKWIKGIDRLFMQRKPGGLKQYARDNYNTHSMTIEYSWCGRTCQDMRVFGLQSLLSVLPIA